MADQQKKQGGDASTTSDRGSSDQPQTDKKIPLGDSEADGMSGSSGRGSTSNPSNPYDTTKGGDRSKSGDPESAGESIGSPGKGDAAKR